MPVDITKVFWAKAEPYGNYPPERIHLLQHHLADAAMVMKALIEIPSFNKRLVELSGYGYLDASLINRLLFFAAIHDIGKAAVGFQLKIRPVELRPKFTASHTFDFMQALFNDQRATRYNT